MPRETDHLGVVMTWDLVNIIVGHSCLERNPALGRVDVQPNVCAVESQ